MGGLIVVALKLYWDGYTIENFPYESIQLILQDFPELFSVAWPIILTITVFLTVVFIMMGARNPIYFKIERSGITTQTSLQRILKKDRIYYAIGDLRNVQWRKRVNRRYGNRSIIFTLNIPSDLKQIRVNEDIFGPFAINQLIIWLNDKKIPH
jgi:hypothetical protein